MSVFTRSMVAGINHGLEKKSHISWPSADVAEREIVKLAESLQGPDILPAGGLARESAVKIANALVAVAAGYKQAGHAPSAEYAQGVKTAASRDLAEVAADHAIAHMRKIASEPLIVAGGEHPNTLSDATATSDIARLDLHNRPEGAYRVAPGVTKLPKGGVVGEEMAHPKAPLTSPALDSSVSKKVAAHVQAGLDSLPAKHKTAALAGVMAGDASVIEGLKTAGRRKLAEMDPQALMAMGEGDAGPEAGPPGAPPAPPAAPPGAEAGQGQLPPELVQLLMQLLSGHGGAAPEAAPEAMAPEAPPAEPPADKGPPTEKDAMLAYLRKVAEGGSLTDSEENTLASAAKTNNVAKLDEHNRAEGAYEVAQGKTEMANAGHIGAKKDVADKPEHPDTVPSREMPKSAAEAEYVQRAVKVANEWLPKLPATMSQAQKLAAIRALTGPTPQEQVDMAKGLLAR